MIKGECYVVVTNRIIRLFTFVSFVCGSPNKCIVDGVCIINDDAYYSIDEIYFSDIDKFIHINKDDWYKYYPNNHPKKISYMRKLKLKLLLDIDI